MFQALRAEAEDKGISGQWMRRAQGLAVSVYRTAAGAPPWAIPAKLRWNKQGAGVSDEWFILEGRPAREGRARIETVADYSDPSQ